MTEEKRYCRVCGRELDESNVGMEGDICWECESDEAMEEGLEEW